jgi:hypothetical protein
MADAVTIANRIQAACAGEPTALVYMALSMVLGAAEARAKRPDLDNLMRLVGQTAKWEFDRCRAAAE